jgi:hypothetical protein
MLARNSLLAWLAAWARCAILEELLVLPDLVLGFEEALDHAVEALAEELDFVAGTAYLDGFEAALSDGMDSFLKQNQWFSENLGSELGQDARYQDNDDANDGPFGPVDGIVPQIEPKHGEDDPEQQCGSEHKEARGQRPESGRSNEASGCFHLRDHNSMITGRRGLVPLARRLSSPRNRF